MITVKFLRDWRSYYVVYSSGEVVQLKDWAYDHPRKKDGHIVVCYGHGDFDCFKIGEDVEVVSRA